VFGEIGLSGEVRPVGQADARLKEAEKLGFEAALTPSKSQKSRKKKDSAPLQVTEINHLRSLIGMFGDAKPTVQAVGE
jgi:DNA repair protein RadA/Sms